MRIATHIGEPTDSKLRLAKQMGLSDIVAGPPRTESGEMPTVEDWERLRRKVESHELTLSVIETIPISDRAMLGLPGRDEDIQSFCQSVLRMGAADIPILCYNWMPVLHAFRTSRNKRIRGGARATAYDHALLEDAPLTEAGEVSAEQLWESLSYFLEIVVPVAEEAGVKLAMHPDDPPISPIRGMARIMSTPEAFQELIDLVPSPNNGITFCQGCFAEMGVDVPETIRYFGEQKKIFFAHFRNVRGAVPSFYETFHDEGDTDMFAALKAYCDVGFDGPMRPDHYPAMEGEEVGEWHVKGRLFAVGYMKGLLEGVQRAC
ncbi:MAG: mannonate dehydratase [Chloroflexota bacterium]|nr:mannonate dehydratase [Chloroflexota bacterium]